VNATVLPLSPEERQQIETAASPLITAARACKIETNQHYSQAAEQLKAIKAAQKNLAAKKKKVRDPIKASLKAVDELFAAPETELEQAEGLYKRAMISFTDAQEEIRRREQARLDKLAQEERERKEAQARKAAADAEAARAAGNEKKAEKLEAKAETLVNTAATIVAPQVQREVPKASGVSQAEYWSAVVVDLEQLVLAVAATIIRTMPKDEVLKKLETMPAVPITALEPCMKFLNNQARMLRKQLQYPGVTPVRESGLRAGSKP